MAHRGVRRNTYLSNYKLIITNIYLKTTFNYNIYNDIIYFFLQYTM